MSDLLRILLKEYISMTSLINASLAYMAKYGKMTLNLVVLCVKLLYVVQNYLLTEGVSRIYYIFFGGKKDIIKKTTKMVNSRCTVITTNCKKSKSSKITNST